MVINKKTQAAIKNKNAATVNKSVKLSKVKKATSARVWKGLTGRAVLHLIGGKGEAFRAVDISKDGYVTRMQTNVGLWADCSAIGNIDLLDESGKTRNGEQRLWLGDYIAQKGCRARVTVLSVSQADKLASHKTVIERGGKQITLRTHGDVENHYVASVEQFKTGVKHYFQLETARIGRVNAKHYGALISTK